jgi:hypothetical protein
VKSFDGIFLECFRSDRARELHYSCFPLPMFYYIILEIYQIKPSAHKITSLERAIEDSKILHRDLYDKLRIIIK